MPAIRPPSTPRGPTSTGALHRIATGRAAHDHQRPPNIIHWNTQTEEILGEGEVTGVRTRNTITQAITAAGTGAMAALEAERYLVMRETPVTVTL